MDLSAEATRVGDEVAAADVVVPVGGRCHWEVGGAAPAGTEVHVGSGVLRYEPADMTATLLAGTTVDELAAVLGEAGQECPLDAPAAATVGGVLNVGLSGWRRLGLGPVRDRVLEVFVVLGDGRLVRGGGPTVKNVTGYDLPRVIVGSHGTLGVLVAVAVRTQPLPAASQWFLSDVTVDETWRRLFRPTAVLWDGDRVHVLLEGDPGDVAAQSAALDATPVEPPNLPDGAHRGRISCSPARLESLGARLRRLDLSWTAEIGVGTLHVTAEHEDALADAREAAHAEGGWLLRESGAPGLDGFGVPLPNAGIMRRVKDSLDPAGKMNPGRLPYGAAVPA